MYLKPGDPVGVNLSDEERISGVVRSAHFAGPFSENWYAIVEVIEGGHPLFARHLPFAFSELSLAGVTA